MKKPEFGVWSSIQTAPTRTSIQEPAQRVLLRRTNGEVSIGCFDPDTYARTPRPFWRDDGIYRKRHADPPTHWMPLPSGELPNPEKNA
jgi:hypothetical protein